MNYPPVFYDPSSRRWTRVKRAAILIVLLGMLVVCALGASILFVPAVNGTDAALPVSAGQPNQEIAHPADASGNLQQQLQQAVAGLNNFVPTPTAAATLRPTLVPANPRAALNTPVPVDPFLTQTPPPQPPQPTSAPPQATATPLPPTAVPVTPTSPLPPTATPRGHKPTPLPTSPNPSPTPTSKPHKRAPTPIAALPASPSVASLLIPGFQNFFAFSPRSLLDWFCHCQTNPSLADQGTASAEPLIIAFYSGWDDSATYSLTQHINQIDRFMPAWLHLTGASGTVSDDNLARENQLLGLIQQNRSGLMVVPMVNSFDPQAGRWNSGLLGQMLADPAARQQTIQNLLQFVQGNHLAGISVDFEDAPPESQPGLQAFMQALYARFHPLGLEVYQVIPLANSAFDTRVYAQSSDRLILAAYDEHWSGGTPGPVASQSWFSAGLDRQLSGLDPARVVVSIGNYGYDWTQGASAGQSLTFQAAVQAASESHAVVTFESQSLNPAFTYTNAKEQAHVVWYLDAVTAFNQVAEGLRRKVGGVALWRLGSEDPSIWQVLKHPLDSSPQTAAALRTLNFGYDITYQGQGEILKITGLPQPGSREVSLDGAGRISSERMVSFPSTYTIMRWGQKEKQIALTFDDGPDPAYTPRVLDVLQEYKIPATFFIVGLNGQQHPELLRQVAGAGYEIGVHTFTHPDISAISPEQLRLELNATQLLLQSQVGAGSILFRPPYGIDAEPRSPQEVKPLVETSQMGYITVGMQIDPGDWRKPGVDAIVAEVLNQLDTTGGNILLLHDGGGDRSQTVAALPKIITALQSRGYHFVPVSALMDLSKDQVMPPVKGSGQFLTRVGLLGFSAAGITLNLGSLLFLITTLLGVGRMLFISILAVLQWQRSSRRPQTAGNQPMVSVLVPAYNEEKVINKTIHSLLGSTYPNLEIVVIDDGSKDDTYAVVLAEFAREPRFRAYKKINGGKAHALNFGIQQARGEIIVILDADTLILPDAIERMVRHFDDPHVCAVAGNAKVGNRLNVLTQMQSLEYITSQNMDRRAFAWLNCITVVPGAIGAWRKESVLQVGGFRTDTLAEDADLTLNILRSGVRIEYEDQAIALTEAPENLRSFLKQRFRWMFGMLQTTWKQKDALFRRRFGTLGWVALPNILIFSIFLPLISPVMDLTFLWSVLNWIVYRFQHPADPNLEYLLPVLEFYAFYLVIDFLVTLLAFIMESKEDWRLIVWLFPQRIFYRLLLVYTSFKTIVSALRGQAVGWGKLERKNTVKL